MEYIRVRIFQPTHLQRPIPNKILHRFANRTFQETVRFLKLIWGCCFLFYAFLLSIAQKVKTKMNGTATADDIPSPGSSVTSLLPSKTTVKSPARVKVPAPTHSPGRFATRSKVVYGLNDVVGLNHYVKPYFRA